MVTVVAISWVVLAPYGTGVLVGSWPRANRVVGRHLLFATSLGWAALATLFAAVFAVGDRPGALVAMAVAPLVGLAFWAPGRRDDGGEKPPDAPDDRPSPSDEIDWDEFRRELDAWSDQRPSISATSSSARSREAAPTSGST